ncbi:hypothetical protein [Arthrobacter sp. KK5.5]
MRKEEEGKTPAAETTTVCLCIWDGGREPVVVDPECRRHPD